MTAEIILTLDSRLAKRVAFKLKESGLNVRHISKMVGSNEHIFHFNDELTDDLRTQVRQIAKNVVVADRFTDVDEYDPLDLKDVTKEQLATYIDNNVTDLASAKLFLRRLAWLTLFLYKRLMRYE